MASAATDRGAALPVPAQLVDRLLDPGLGAEPLVDGYGDLGHLGSRVQVQDQPVQVVTVMAMTGPGGGVAWYWG